MKDIDNTVEVDELKQSVSDLKDKKNDKSNFVLVAVFAVLALVIIELGSLLIQTRNQLQDIQLQMMEERLEMIQESKDN